MKKKSFTNEKYNVFAEMEYDENISILNFWYRSQQIRLSWDNSDPSDSEEEGASLLIERYIEKLVEGREHVTTYRNWHIRESELADDKGKLIGIRARRDYRYEAKMTSVESIGKVVVDESNHRALALSSGRIYVCPLEFCDFLQQDKSPYMFVDYYKLKPLYENKRKERAIDSGKVHLRLSNYKAYYFESIYYKAYDRKDDIRFFSAANPAANQDSFTIMAKEEPRIDLRYIVEFGYIQFYSQDTKGISLFIENTGDIEMTVVTNIGTMHLKPNEVKEVVEHNMDDSETGYIFSFEKEEKFLTDRYGR